MRPAFTTVNNVLNQGAERLAAAGVENPRREARLLLSAAVGAQPDALLGRTEGVVGPDAAATFRSFLERRAGREPISQILGRREFWSLDIEVTAEVLTPRPDTESVVEAALATVADPMARLRILDLGTGSGCLLLALLRELPRASGLGIDISSAACEVARRNATTLGVEDRARFVVGDWGDSVFGTFDLIVTNPPYILSADVVFLMPEVREYEPRLALDGGVDGLSAYRRLLPRAATLLGAGGSLVLEVGCGQAQGVEALLRDVGLVPKGRRAGLDGIDRALTAVPRQTPGR